MEDVKLCPVCGNALPYKLASRLARYRHCSKACADYSRRKTPEQRLKVSDKNCEQCGRVLVYKSPGQLPRKRFCSPSCRSRFTAIRDGAKKAATAEARFWSRVDRQDGQCWIWNGRLTPKQYGTMSVAGRHLFAHRISWELHRGVIPEGKAVLHRCDVRNCVNPDHLFLGTQRDNIADMDAKGRRGTTRKRDASAA